MCAWAAALLLLLLPPVAVRAPSFGDVLRNVTAYVDAFGEHASILVGTERYAQHVTGSGALNRQRSILADLGIVWAASHTRLGFRDVIAVDGNSVAACLPSESRPHQQAVSDPAR
ncbi:MAG TPA: hypothetical protein VFX12_04695 [Vicinamibacterales bacterium]|nr:hypothetical protein [Vicinamibacterales bacterium]